MVYIAVYIVVYIVVYMYKVVMYIVMYIAMYIRGVLKYIPPPHFIEIYEYILFRRGRPKSPQMYLQTVKD